jgi:hypothetical protein
MPRMTLSRLVASHDAVPTGLRGFSRSNQGCVLELNELVNVVSLPKVVLAVDRTADLPFLHKILAPARATMAAASPNRRLRPAQLAVRRLRGHDANGARLLLAGIARSAVSQDGARLSEPVPA